MYLVHPRKPRALRAPTGRLVGSLSEAGLWEGRGTAPRVEAGRLASGHLPACLHLCLRDTHFLSCIPHKAGAHGPELGRFPSSQSEVLFPVPNSLSLLCLLGSSENPSTQRGCSKLLDALNKWQVLQVLPNRGQTSWNLRLN